MSDDTLLPSDIDATDVLHNLLSGDLVDSAPDGLLVIDGDGTIVLVNAALELLFGYRRQELLGQRVEVLLPEEARHAHEAHRASFARAPHARAMGRGMTLVGCRRDGSRFPVEISLSPITKDERLYTMAAVRDVSERVIAEEALNETRNDLTRSAERERIARDLHDTVIQHLFAVGIQLQGVAARMEPGQQADRVQWAVDHLDQTIREVRSVIFGLSSSSTGGGMRSRIKELAAEAAHNLGFEPRLVFDGLIDTSVSSTLGDQVLAILREALSNVVRHAQARRVDINLMVTDDALELTVTDDGVGMPAEIARGNGLVNLRERALQLGGTVEWRPRPEGGTVMELRAPLSMADD